MHIIRIHVRAAINRHLKDIGRHCPANAKLKFNLRNGLSRPTQHHQIVREFDQLQWLTIV